MVPPFAQFLCYFVLTKEVAAGKHEFLRHYAVLRVLARGLACVALLKSLRAEDTADGIVLESVVFLRHPVHRVVVLI